MGEKNLKNDCKKTLKARKKYFRVKKLFEKNFLKKTCFSNHSKMSNTMLIITPLQYKVSISNSGNSLNRNFDWILTGFCHSSGP